MSRCTSKHKIRLKIGEFSGKLICMKLFLIHQSATIYWVNSISSNYGKIWGLQELTIPETEELVGEIKPRLGKSYLTGPDWADSDWEWMGRDLQVFRTDLLAGLKENLSGQVLDLVLGHQGSHFGQSLTGWETCSKSLNLFRHNFSIWKTKGRVCFVDLVQLLIASRFLDSKILCHPHFYFSFEKKILPMLGISIKPINGIFKTLYSRRLCHKFFLIFKKL